MSEREEMFIENIKKVAKKYNLNPKIIHMTIAFQEYMFRWDMFESGDYTLRPASLATSIIGKPTTRRSPKPATMSVRSTTSTAANIP